MPDLFTQQISKPIKKAAHRTTIAGSIDLFDAPIQKRSFTTDDRKKLADSGAAMDDGSYPITQPVDVTNAVKDYGRTGQDPAVKAHIISRAKAIGATDALPDDWIAKYNENHDDHGRFGSGGSGSSSGGKDLASHLNSFSTKDALAAHLGANHGNAGKDADGLSDMKTDHELAHELLARQNAEPLSGPRSRPMTNGSKDGPWPVDKN